ncbi:MAG: nucleotidyltransferase domain-containing protein [Candidatus Nanoarchaeia archaeon]
MVTIGSEKEREILSYFFRNPTNEIHLRELSRKTKISFPWTRTIVLKLIKKELLSERKLGNLILLKANRENSHFRALKRSHNLFSLYEAGLIEKLKEEYHHPEAIILFGSYSRGEDTEQSDIDIAVFTGRNKQVDLSFFGKKLEREIKIIILQRGVVNKEFLSSLANGIVLEGYLNL